MKVLVAGWFSFEKMGATAGDLLSCDLVCDWLKRAGHSFDVALAPPFPGGVDWRLVDPRIYSHVVFVCGPFGNGWPITDFLQRFASCRLVGVNLSMLEALDTWNPFHLLFERDSSATSRPDITLLSDQGRVPIVGVVLVHSQNEYGGKAMHERANEAIQHLVAAREMSVVRIDTRLDVNSTGLRTAAEIESLIARMDVIVTTRLHGMVLAIKNGVPPVVIDPVAGGAKIRRQADALGWPVVFTADRLLDGELEKAFDYCLTEDARAKAQKCREVAIEKVKEVKERFIAEMSLQPPMSNH